MKNVEDIYPLSPLQGSLLAHALAYPGSGVGFQQVGVSLFGRLDREAFRGAWSQVVARHPVLRTAFLWEDLDRPVQLVRRTVELPYREHDWRGLPSGDQEERFNRLLAEDVAEGFRLSRAPLMRCTLVRFGEDRHRFVWSYHHLVLDGWCQSEVLGEVQALYAAHLTGDDPLLPERPPFRAYISWLADRAPEESESFWRERLAGLRSPTPLTIDRPTPEIVGAAGPSIARTEAVLTAAKMERLRNLAREHRITLNTVVQGAWAIVLARYSGHRDIVFGTSVSGRPAELPRAGEIIGMFLNNLPLRVEVDPAAPVVRWLAEVQKRHAEVREHQHTPLERVHEWAGLPWGRRLFESLLTFENLPNQAAERRPESRNGRLRVEPLREFQASGYPLNLLVAPDDVLSQTLDFDPRRIPAGAARRALGHLGQLLGEILDRPETPIRALSMLPPEERSWVLDAGRRSPVRPLASSAGDVAPNSLLAVLDVHGQLAPPGVPGPLHIRAEDGGEWRPTGEAARCLPEGMLKVLGRVEDRIERQGLSAVAGEVETLLLSHPEIAEAAVVQLEPEAPLTAFIVSRGEEPSPRVVRRFVGSRLPAWMVPTAYRFARELPRDGNGYPDREALEKAARDEVADSAMEAPADSLEGTLLEVWQDLFGLGPLGVTEDFFELGGHSLLAVRLAAQMEERTGRRLPLGALVEGRTVRGVAAYLRGEGEGEERSSPLVEIQGGGEQVPFFCVHPVGGHVLCYRPLAQHLGESWPFYGLAAPGLEDAVADEPIEAMATRYVRALTGHHPQGPCLLGGWSFGGVVAFEMARQLRALGREVALLAVFDTLSPLLDSEVREGDYAAQMAGLAREHAWQYGRDLPLRATDLRSLGREDQLRHILEVLRRERLIAPEIGLPWLRRFAAGHRSRLEARMRYTPEVFEGKITLFRARCVDDRYVADLTAEGREQLQEWDLGWTPLSTHPVSVRDVPGTHGTMMSEPNVRDVAASLRQAIQDSLPSIVT